MAGEHLHLTKLRQITQFKDLNEEISSENTLSLNGSMDHPDKARVNITPNSTIIEK